MAKYVLLAIKSILAMVVIVNASSNGEQDKYIISTEKVSFFEAYLRCRQIGLDPAEIITEQDQKDIEKALQSSVDLSWELGYWLFATNLGNSLSYYWLNSGLPIIFSRFQPGQPDNSANTENCLEIFQPSKGVFTWNDMPCNYKLRFICQRKQRSTDTCNHNRFSEL